MTRGGIHAVKKVETQLRPKQMAASSYVVHVAPRSGGVARKQTDRAWPDQEATRIHRQRTRAAGECTVHKAARLLLEVKLTFGADVHMSAYDPKRTSKARHWTAPFSNSKAATLRGECHQRVTPKRLRPSFASWCAVTIGWWHGWRRSARARRFKIFAQVLLLAQKRSSAG